MKKSKKEEEQSFQKDKFFILNFYSEKIKIVEELIEYNRNRYTSQEINDLKRILIDLQKIHEQIRMVDDKSRLSELNHPMFGLMLKAKAADFKRKNPDVFYSFESLKSEFLKELNFFIDHSLKDVELETVKRIFSKTEIERTKSKIKELSVLTDVPDKEPWHNVAIIGLNQFLEYLYNTFGNPETSDSQSQSLKDITDYLRKSFDEIKNQNQRNVNSVTDFLDQKHLNKRLAIPKTIESRSFFWTGSQTQLEALWQALNKAGYIHPDTTKEAFAAIFSGSVNDGSLHRIIWIKKAQRSKYIAKNAVIALFTILAEYDKIPKDEINNKAELFRKLESCFCDMTGKALKFEHKHTSYSKENTDPIRQIISSL